MFYCFKVKVRLHIHKTRTIKVHGMFDSWDGQEKYTDIMEVEFPVSCKTPSTGDAMRNYIGTHYPYDNIIIEEIYSNPITADEFAKLSAL